MSNQPEHSSEELDDPMPFYRILEEEYRKLHSIKKNEGEHREVIDWTFDADQIVDPRDLARRFKVASTPQGRMNSEDVAVTVLNNADRTFLDTACAYLDDSGTVDESKRDDFKQQLVVVLNSLLNVKDFHEQKCVMALPLSPYATRLRDSELITGEHKLAEANRLFLEAAFPTQLARMRDRRLSVTYEKIRKERHTALCLSGGGIRSATFALGVVQALAQKESLAQFDYISTVSGGGFLGGWLSAWMKHAGPKNVEDALRHTPVAKLDPEPVPIRHLRAFTNYLSPKLGLLSADTWTLAATYIRNVLLNWLVIIPFIAAALFVPWAAVSIMNSRPEEWPWLGNVVFPLSWIPQWDWLGATVRSWSGFRTHQLVVWGYAVGFVSGAIAVWYVHRDEPKARDGTKRLTQGNTQNEFLFRCLGPLVLCAIVLTTAFSLSWSWDFAKGSELPENLWKYFAGFGVAIHLVGWLCAIPSSWKRFIVGMVVILISAGLIGALSGWIAPMLVQYPKYYITFAMPIYLCLLMLSGQIYLGLVSRGASDSDREWGARFDAWIFIVVVAWSAISAIVLWGPDIFSYGYRLLIGGGLGGISGIITLVLGGSAKTDGKPENAAIGSSVTATRSLTRKLADLALGLAAPLFAIALLILISTLDIWMIDRMCAIDHAMCNDYVNIDSILDVVLDVRPLGVVIAMAFMIVLGVIFGMTIDTNEFSLHAMYRMRLIRAYLGGSRPAGERRPDFFTGFDEDDDVLLRELWPAEGTMKQPLHVVNVTLNLVSGEKLAWQERKAESFTMTPLHAGSAYLGYRRTSSDEVKSEKSRKRLYSGGQLSLGTAVAISGAAASPNMGYHSSSVITFLMTLFNARLGGWFGNTGPSGEKSYMLKHPKIAVKPILSELFGLSDDRSDYIYLSDGGHFENIALYEMVLRRCRFIVVSDASCDEDCSFSDLGNAIRKIRVDLGVPIEFDDQMMIAPRSTVPTAANRAWAIGRIRYSCVDRQYNKPQTANLTDDQYDGILIYIKPSYYGLSEPPDVYNYAKSAPAFPHESTADQFFSESQFESYRALGSHIVSEMWNDARVQRAFSKAGFI